MIAYELIHKQQQGIPLSGAEIAWLVDGFTNGSVPDEQLAAWLMAVYFKGMTGSERQALVAAMVASGRRLDFSALDGYVADKHSTGGVGDKISLILAPLVAACGVYVPMISGRGLGHTGGTLDKLESIPGFGTNLELDAFQRQVGEVGVAIMSQTDEIVPADRKMYALRDVTATVGSLPLICGSIMSKKIAEGIQGLVLDVKWGNGAFMTTLDEARALAEALQQTGADFGVDTVARITDMNQPLGRAAGLWCEVQEALAVLEKADPQVPEVDLLFLRGRFQIEAHRERDAIASLTRHLELLPPNDPRQAVGRGLLGWAHHLAMNADSARPRLEQARQLGLAELDRIGTDMMTFSPTMRLAGWEALLGLPDQARRHADEAVAALPVSLDVWRGQERLTDQAWVYYATGETGRAFDILEQVLAEPRYPGKKRLLQWRRWEALRQDPRYPALAAKYGLLN